MTPRVAASSASTVALRGCLRAARRLFGGWRRFDEFALGAGKLLRAGQDRNALRRADQVHAPMLAVDALGDVALANFALARPHVDISVGREGVRSRFRCRRGFGQSRAGHCRGARAANAV
jgi:hypothetical protein